MITTLTINPAIDLTLEFDRLLIEDVNRVKSFHEDAGGKGINVSKVLHELGMTRVVTLAVLGSSERTHRIKHYASRIGLKIQPAVTLQGDTRINVTLYDQASRKTTKLNQPGPEIRESEIRKLWSSCHEAARRSKFFVMAGSLLPNMKSNWYGSLIKSIRRKGLSTVLDADDKVLKSALSAKPFLIKPNRYEAERVLGKKLTSEKALWWGARRLRELGAENVIISLGREGALFSGPETELRAYSFPVKIRSTVGAGDSLLAGFLYQFSRSQRVEQALKFGLACGTHTAMTGAAELCFKTVVMKLLPKIKIKKLK